ncbi:MAG: hypothetical protein V1773_00980 [bacterium]
MKTKINLLKNIENQNDLRWLLFWLVGIQLMLVWDKLFLNKPAFKLLEKAFLNSFVVGFFVILFSVLLAWGVVNTAFKLRSNNKATGYYILTFIINLIRSVPQILGVLLGYVLLTFILDKELFKNEVSVLIFIAFIISIFVFLELYDELEARIEHYKKSDFYPAMLVCGISEFRIINFEILFKNSIANIFHKLLSLFGVALFLQCSIDFIVSVGLSNDVSLSNFPVTLGSLLAKMDSKQDILALGKTLTDPLYGVNLLFKHLQGLSVAFVIVFTLLSVFKISNGFIKRISR